MAKRNGNKTAKKPTVGRDMPLPRTLPEHLKPYDANNDGVLSKEERIAMVRAKRQEEIKGMKKEESVRARKKMN
jgi:hypothetical protein